MEEEERRARTRGVGKCLSQHVFGWSNFLPVGVVVGVWMESNLLFAWKLPSFPASAVGAEGNLRPPEEEDSASAVDEDEISEKLFLLPEKGT